jgi:hypothetical protein
MEICYGSGRRQDNQGSVMTGKYASLEKFLRDLPASRREVTLGFDQVERILNSKLPASAYEDRRWWDHGTEGNHRSKRAWANAGWEIASLDVSQQWVRLVRAATAV